MNYKICKTSARIPGPQSQVVHVDKLKLIHIEPGLEESRIPEKEDSSTFLSNIDGVHPHRIITKPKHLTNDYVCNLFLASSSSDQAVLSCHLCAPAPFASRPLRKGHLYMMHGMKSADVTSLESIHRTRDAPSHPEVDKPCQSLDKPPAVVAYEDISNDASEVFPEASTI